MKDLENLPVLVQLSELKELKESDKKKDEIIKFYKEEILKNIELFLSFWYKESSEFGKIKDSFNDHNEFPCEMRIKDGRVKLKINNEDKK